MKEETVNTVYHICVFTIIVVIVTALAGYSIPLILSGGGAYALGLIVSKEWINEDE